MGRQYARPGLPLHDRYLATIAALTAQGSQTRPQLMISIQAGRKSGLSQQEIAEAIWQMALYGGLPATINALNSISIGDLRDGKGVGKELGPGLIGTRMRVSRLIEPGAGRIVRRLTAPGGTRTMTEARAIFELAGRRNATPPLGEATLVLIDYQNEYREGSLKLVGVEAAIGRAAALLHAARRAGAR